MKRTVLTLLVLTSLVISIVPTISAQAAAFADPAFQAVWNRTDAAVRDRRSTTSWLWGPEPLSPAVRERYDQSPGNTRLVQYFDKARMEINNPNANRDALWFVTNGLLPIELITGQMQVGDAQFEQRQPATIPVIGDPDNLFPTYADLATVFTRQGAGDRIGNPVTGFLNPDGTISGYDVYRSDSATHVAAIEQGHGIPAAFVNHMNAQSGSLDRLFVFGYPVSGAYWVNVKVAYREQPVMFQVFERRVLTYTPNNPEAFRVESGNVGRHYLQWRYPAPTVEVTPPEAPVGTTFTVRVSGLPAGEEATVRVSPAPLDPGYFLTIVGNGGTVTFDVPTTTQSSTGTWAVGVYRSSISSIIGTIVRFTVTAP